MKTTTSAYMEIGGKRITGWPASLAIIALFVVPMALSFFAGYLVGSTP